MKNKSLKINLARCFHQSSNSLYKSITMATDSSKALIDKKDKNNRSLAAADAKQDHIKMPSKKDDSSTHSSFEKMSEENPKPDGGRHW